MWEEMGLGDGRSDTEEADKEARPMLDGRISDLFGVTEICGLAL